MIGETARSTSFGESAEYVLNLKPEHRKLTKEEREEAFPAVPATPEAPAWEAGCRHRVIAGNMSGENERELNWEFVAIRKLRPDIKNPLLCISIRKAPSETVTVNQWEEVAARAVEGLGLQECPYLVVQHRDQDDHVHVLASLIRLDGKVISDSQSYRKVERVMREVEARHGFIRVKSSRDSLNSSPTWIEQQRFKEDGTLSSKMELQARISRVLESQPTTTQFINLLQAEHDVKVFPRLDANGCPQGIAFGFGDAAMSGTTIGRGYSWNGLLERGLSFSEHDHEAVRQAGERARIERRRKAGEQLSFDDELELALGGVAVTKTTDDEEMALRELMSQVVASQNEYAAARQVPTVRQTSRTTSPSPDSDLPPAIELATINNSHIDEDSTSHNLREAARIEEDLPLALPASTPASRQSDSRLDRALPAPKAAADDLPLPVEVRPVGVQLNAVAQVDIRERENDSQSKLPTIKAARKSIGKSVVEVSEIAPVIRRPTLDTPAQPTLSLAVQPNNAEAVHLPLAEHSNVVANLDRQKPETLIPTSESEKPQRDSVALDAPLAFTSPQVKREEEDAPVQSAAEASDYLVSPAQPVAGDDSASQNNERRVIASSGGSTVNNKSRSVPFPPAETHESPIMPQQVGVETEIRPASEIAFDVNDLPPMPNLVSMTKAIDRPSTGEVHTKKTTVLTVESVQALQQDEQPAVSEVSTDAAAPPKQKQVVEAVSEETTRVEDNHFLKGGPTSAGRPDGIPLNSLPIPIEPESLASQPSPPLPLSPTGATRSTAAAPPVSVGNEVTVPTKPTGRSFLKPLRDFFDPRVREQKILDKYHVEREAARESLKTSSGECLLRAQAMLDRAIINSARGQKHTLISDYDLSRVLPSIHDVGKLKEGKNWMEIGRRIAQQRGDSSVWQELGQEVGVAARAAARADAAEFRRQAYSAYKAKYTYAPHEDIKKIFEREQERLEQQPATAKSIALVNQINELRAADKQSPLPVTKQEAWALICRRLKDGDGRALHLFEQTERKGVKQLTSEKLAELKPLRPAYYGADGDVISEVMIRHAHIVEGAREWYKDATGNDFTPEQHSVFVRTVWERAHYIKPDAEEQRAVRLLSLKRGIPPPPLESSLAARIKCAELAGTDGRETWGQVAIEIQKRHDEIDAKEREREAEERRQAEQARQRATRIAAQFKAALPKTPKTPERLAPPTVKQTLELTAQREKEIATRYVQWISFTEEQCRRAGEVPTTYSRKALIAMLAMQDATKPTAQTLSAYKYLHVAKEAPPPLVQNEVQALTIVNNYAVR